MAEHMNSETGLAWLSVATLAKLTGLKPRAVQNARAALTRAGYISPVENTGGRYKSAPYAIETERVHENAPIPDIAAACRMFGERVHSDNQKGAQENQKGAREQHKTVHENAPELTYEPTYETTKGTAAREAEAEHDISTDAHAAAVSSSLGISDDSPVTDEHDARAPEIVLAYTNALDATLGEGTAARRTGQAQEFSAALVMALGGATVRLCQDVFTAVLERRKGKGEGPPAGLAYFRPAVVEAVTKGRMNIAQPYKPNNTSTPHTTVVKPSDRVAYLRNGTELTGDEAIAWDYRTDPEYPVRRGWITAEYQAETLARLRAMNTR